MQRPTISTFHFLLVNTLRSIVWPQEVVEVAKVLQEQNQQVLFGKQNYSLLMRKKDKGQITPPKLMKSKIVIKQKCCS